jgi:ABC-type cobalamin transport system permease subunit
MSGKPWYKSRTVWTNIGTAVAVAVAASAQYIHGNPLIDPGVQGTIVGLFVSGVNLILRWRTGQPLN